MPAALKRVDLSPPAALFSLEAEQSLLGALLLDNDAYRRVADMVDAADFYVEAHRLFFRTIATLIRGGTSADIVTVAACLEAHDAEAFSKAGGAAYLCEMAQNTPSALNVASYARLVRDKAVRRRAAQVGEDLRQTALVPGKEIAHFLAEARERLEFERARLKRPSARAPIDWRALVGKVPPARLWAMSDWIGRGHATLMPGPGGIGKTLLAQQIASAFTIGRDFISTVPAALNVLFWACEDDEDELWRRQLNIARFFGVELDAFADRLHLVSRLGMDNTLLSLEYGRLALTPQIDMLREQAEDLKAEVVVVDNVAQTFGGNENDRHHVTLYVNTLLGALPGRAIILLAHPSRASGSEFSGSSAWDAAVRARLYLGATLPDQKQGGEEADETVRYLARRKANYSAKDWRRLTFRGGVLVPDDTPAAGTVAQIVRQTDAERTVMEGLRRLHGLKLAPTDTKGTERYLPRMLIDYKLHDGLQSSELAEAMRRLMKEGRIERAVVGRYGNRAEKYGLMVVGS